MDCHGVFFKGLQPGAPEHINVYKRTTRFASLQVENQTAIPHSARLLISKAFATRTLDLSSDTRPPNLVFSALSMISKLLISFKFASLIVPWKA
jgi:hypothetical protein